MTKTTFETLMERAKSYTPGTAAQYGTFEKACIAATTTAERVEALAGLQRCVIAQCDSWERRGYEAGNKAGRECGW